MGCMVSNEVTFGYFGSHLTNILCNCYLMDCDLIPIYYVLIYSYTHILMYSYTYTLIYSYTHILIHSYTHILIYSYTHILLATNAMVQRAV